MHREPSRGLCLLSALAVRAALQAEQGDLSHSTPHLSLTWAWGMKELIWSSTSTEIHSEEKTPNPAALYTLPFCLWFKLWIQHICAHKLSVQPYWCCNWSWSLLFPQNLIDVGVIITPALAWAAFRWGFVSSWLLLHSEICPNTHWFSEHHCWKPEGGISGLFHRWENEAGWERTCWRSCAQQCQKLHQSSWLLNASWALGSVSVLFCFSPSKSEWFWMR